MSTGTNTLLTVKQVAAWIGCSPGWVYDHVSGKRRPQLPAAKFGKTIRFREEAVEKFIRDCEKGAAA